MKRPKNQPPLSIVPQSDEPTPPPAPETPARVGTDVVRVLISDDEAREVLALNRAIVRAQDAVSETDQRMQARVVALATAYGISLDPTDGRWHFDAGTGVFTRMPQEAAK